MGDKEDRKPINENEENQPDGGQKQGERVRQSRRKKEKTGWRQELRDWIQIIVTAVLIAFVINTFIIANSDIPSGSMENTIMTGSRVMGSRLHYKFADPERGDIIIFRFGWRCPVCQEAIEGERRNICPVCGSQVNRKGKKVYYVKRAIGLPGETVDIIDGKVYIDGSDTPLKEDYLPEEMRPHEPMHFEVPEDSYFMMGDNRNDSHDSRFWHNHYLAREKIRAKVLFEYFPEIKALH